MSTTTQLLQAIHTLHASTTDALMRKAASDWLEVFEKQHEAWATASQLLLDQSKPTEARIFSAQIIRHKVATELHTVDVAGLESLRNNVVECLNANIATKPIVTQLCCALAELAIYSKGWDNPVQHITALYGGKQETTMVFLEFLTVLPEELEASQKVMTREEYHGKFVQLLEANAAPLFQSLVASLREAATPFELKRTLFKCLESWMSTQAIPLQVLNATPIIDMAFDALIHDELFDSAVSILACIFEKAHVDIMSKQEQGLLVANKAMPRLTQYKSLLNNDSEDEDKCRGYCRLFSQAGENFLPLIAENSRTCADLLEGILIVTSYHHLDAVKITFPFWYYLSQCLNDPTYQVRDADVFTSLYSSLVDIMIRHLRYPDDLNSWTAKEKDDFRDFRHEMGDVLKDCVHVLGDSAVLTKAYTLMENAISKINVTNNIHGGGWPDIEAPLFALRTTGTAVRPEEAEVLPKLMSKLQQLPHHPKIQYGVVLLIGVVSKWTRAHPEYLAYQMQYISSGFSDEELIPAAAKTLKYLCHDCGDLLIDYLEQLHPFYMSVTPKIQKDDSLDITEAIAHIIARAPLANMLNLLRSFTLPILTRLSQILEPTQNPNDMTLVREINDLLHRLSFFIKFVQPNVPLGASHPVVTLLEDSWDILLGLLSKFAMQDPVTEGVCKVLRGSVNDSCAEHYGDLIQKLVELLASSYQQTHFSCYLWVSMHVLSSFAHRNNGRYQPPLVAFFEQMTAYTMSYFEQTSFQDHEVVDEFFGFVDTFLNALPDIFFGLPSLPSLLSCTVASMNHSYYPRPLSSIVTMLNDYMSLITSTRQLQQQAKVSEQGRLKGAQMFFPQGYEIVNSLIARRLEGLLPSDAFNDFTNVILDIGKTYPNDAPGWIVKAVAQINSSIFSDGERQQFGQDTQRAIQSDSFGTLRDVLNKLAIMYKRRTSQAKRRY